MSDDNYWRDFSRSSASLTQRLLTNDGQLELELVRRQPVGRIQRWQTLQDVDSADHAALRPRPQLDRRRARSNNLWRPGHPGGADYTRFTHTITPRRAAFPTTRE